MGKRTRLLVVVLSLALTGCATHTDAAKRVVPVRVRNTTTTTTTAQPVIDVSTLRRLAAIAQSASAGWSEPHPWNIRVALGSQRGAEAIGVTFAYGETAPRLVIALDGRFVCRAPVCATSGGGGPNPDPPTTSVTTQAPVMTMLLTVDPSTLNRDLYIGVFVRDVDMGTLGKVFALDGYLTR